MEKVIKKNVLVFPCGSEIGLEIYRSLRYSAHFNLFGASSVDDHGKFLYANYIAGVPFVTDPNFIAEIKKIVADYHIDAIYPAMDSVITTLAEHSEELGCKVICSPVETTEICLSKSKTYNALHLVVKTPRVYDANNIERYPVFAKPDIGYGSRGAKLITDKETLASHLRDYPTCILVEYLPGKEYTVDCFTDKNGKLLFVGPRERRRINNGISVNTIPVEESKEFFFDIAKRINETIPFIGAWFVQLKRSADGELVVMEIASRLGGSSSVFRNLGVNFALLSLFTAFDVDVDIIQNSYSIELDRSLDSAFKLGIDYNEVFVDFDDCVVVDDCVNVKLIAFLYQCVNEQKKITLLTRHKEQINDSLSKFRLDGIFDRVIHITDGRKKSYFIDNMKAIFIDDSHSERKDVSLRCSIPVFSPDMVESLLVRW